MKQYSKVLERVTLELSYVVNFKNEVLSFLEYLRTNKINFFKVSEYSDKKLILEYLIENGLLLESGDYYTVTIKFPKLTKKQVEVATGNALKYLTK